MHGDEGKPSLLAFCWMDRDRRYFIASGSSLSPGSPYIIMKWNQVNIEYPKSETERV